MSDSALTVDILAEHQGPSEGAVVGAAVGAGWTMAVCRAGALAERSTTIDDHLRLYAGLDLVCVAQRAALDGLVESDDLERLVEVQPTGPGAWDLVEALDRVALRARRQRERPVRPHPDLVGGRLRGDGAGYPVLRRGGRLLDADPALDWQAEPAVLPVLNLSLGPSSVVHRVDAGDPVQAATYSCSRWALVVAAAGNSGGDGSHETMSAWAEPGWVMAVGATRGGPQGTRELAPRSSRGRRDAPWSGPTLVADGRSALDAELFGTSFAAPRVAGLACHLAAAILQLSHLGQREVGGEVLGVPLVAPVIVDSFGGGRWFAGPGRLPTPALPIAGPNGLAAEVMGHLARHDPSAIARGSAALLGRLLIESAQPLDRYHTHEVGHGEVDREGVIGLLCRLSASDWLERLGLAHHLDAVPERLRTVPLFDEDGLHDLMGVVEASWPLVMCDRRTAEIRVRPLAT